MFENPQCQPYHVSDKAILMGDAAHAMVPFYGQGMNAGFEDCLLLDQLLSRPGAKGTLTHALKDFSEHRVKDAHAICDLAMYNYVEVSASTNGSKIYSVNEFSIVTPFTFSEIEGEFSTELSLAFEVNTNIYLTDC